MTTNDTEAGKPAQADEPLALRLNTQLGQAGQESSGMRTTEAMAADRYRVVQTGLGWWRVKIGDGQQTFGRCFTKAHAERIASALRAARTPARMRAGGAVVKPNAEVSGAGTVSAGLPGYAGDNNGER